MLALASVGRRTTCAVATALLMLGSTGAPLVTSASAPRLRRVRTRLAAPLRLAGCPGMIRRVEDGARTAQQYDAMAAEYAADNATSPYNAFYERPATMALIANIAARRVLETGCGT